MEKNKNRLFECYSGSR